jgi:2-octaprenyl-6-methoxyphenol hydroxylase
MLDRETDRSAPVDLAILGAGPVGMTLARALAGSGLTIALIDAKPFDKSAQQADPRALALSHGTRQLLAALDAWPQRAATPITHIHISQRGGFGRTLLDASEHRLPALGYVLRYGALSAALQQSLAAPDHRDSQLRIIDQAAVFAIDTGSDAATVHYRQQGEAQRLTARLVVHAEGTPGDDPAVNVKDYRQHAVLAEVRISPAHDQRAWERFTPDGPLALLPLDDGLAIVFTVPPAKADMLMQLDDAAFLAALQNQFGQRLTFTGTGPRSRYPLALRLRKELVGPREVWIGNSAQTLHPVSGQGFNLGIRDARELADALLRDLERDPGDAARLAAYARQRQLDRRGSAGFTDGIVDLFSNDIAPLRALRGLGLLALDLCPPARRFVAKRMIWGARAWP